MRLAGTLKFVSCRYDKQASCRTARAERVKQRRAYRVRMRAQGEAVRRPRVGRRMALLTRMVAATPGKSRAWYAVRVGPNGSMRYGYAIIGRAVRAGLVRVEVEGRLGRLHLTPAGLVTISGE